MKYTQNYSLIFSSCRSLLDDQITESLDLVRLSMANNQQLTLEYLCVIAEYLTAYNELSNLSFFVKTIHFKMYN